MQLGDGQATVAGQSSSQCYVGDLGIGCELLHGDAHVGAESFDSKAEVFLFRCCVHTDTLPCPYGLMSSRNTKVVKSFCSVPEWTQWGTLCRVNDKKDIDPFDEVVSEVTKEIFTEQDFGKARLVRATGISRSTIGRYLDGERGMRVVELRKIADALGTTPAKILVEAQRRFQKLDKRDV